MKVNDSILSWKVNDPRLDWRLAKRSADTNLSPSHFADLTLVFLDGEYYHTDFGVAEIVVHEHIGRRAGRYRTYKTLQPSGNGLHTHPLVIGSCPV